MANKASESEEFCFDDDLRRLEKVVDELERGEGGLSDALARYEKGVKLVVRCQAALEKAERSIAVLTGVDSAGNPVTAPFDASATAPAASETPASPPKRPRSRPNRNQNDDDIPF